MLNNRLAQNNDDNTEYHHDIFFILFVRVTVLIIQKTKTERTTVCEINEKKTYIYINKPSYFTMYDKKKNTHLVILRVLNLFKNMKCWADIISSS